MRAARSKTPTAPPTREALEQQVTAEGHAWAARIIAELHGFGRAIVGGWPGTRSEAVRLVHARLQVVSSVAGLLTMAEIEDLTRLMYSTAKRDWLLRARPEHGEEDSAHEGETYELSELNAANEHHEQNEQEDNGDDRT